MTGDSTTEREAMAMIKQTMVMATTPDQAVEELRRTLAEIELQVVTGYTLADAMREGATVTGQKIGGWIEGGTACALGAAYLSAKARGYIG